MTSINFAPTAASASAAALPCRPRQQPCHNCTNVCLPTGIQAMKQQPESGPSPIMTLNDGTAEPVLTIGLRQGNSFGNDMLQLHRPSFAGLNNVEITTFEAQRTVPLVCSGLDEKARRLDLIAALRAGLLELIEQDSQQIVRVAHAPQPVYRIEIPPKPSPAWRQSRVGLGIDSTAPFWKDTLQPGKAYALRFSADGGEAWCFHTDSTGSENLPVRREPDTVTFTVHDDPAPPTFSAALSVEPGTASRSGIPPFRFVVYIASEADEPVTVCTVHTPFGGELNCVDQLVRCVDIETGEEVEFPAQFGCFTEDPSPEFPEDSRFVEVWPGKQWHFEHTLDELSDRTLGGLECLESGRRYGVELSKSARSGFGIWMIGRKDELLRGTVQENKGRWQAGPSGWGSITVRQKNDRVAFDVVD